MRRRLPTLSFREVVRALERLGFQIDHVTGSHYRLKHTLDQRRTTVVPRHSRDIKRAVLRAIIKQVLISDGDQGVAQLGPPEAARCGDVADALLADAVRRGLITPAALPPGEPPPAPPGLMSLEQLLADLDQSRADR